MGGNQYWFARRNPVGRGGGKMGPVTREGWLVVAVFVVGMMLGGVVFVLLALADQFPLGIVLFVLIDLVAAGQFLWFAIRKGDQTWTVADYRAGKGAT